MKHLEKITKIKDISNNALNDSSNIFIENNTKYYIDKIINSILINNFFYISLGLSFFFLSKYTNTSILLLWFGFLTTSLFGWSLHWLSHHLSFRNQFNRQDNIFTSNTFLHKSIEIITSILDFHDSIHHNTTINKTHINTIYEFLNNIFVQSGFIVLWKFVLSHIPYSICIYWGLLYASIHIINYNYIKPIEHKEHHINKFTNYGMDLWDILFGTKYNYEHIENYNHGVINILIITLILIYYYTYLTK